MDDASPSLVDGPESSDVVGTKNHHHHHWCFPSDLIDEDGLISYFAFGSNLLPKRMEDRGISLDHCDPPDPALLPRWVFRLNLIGFPPVEPTFGNIEPLGHDNCDENAPLDGVHGVLYRLQPSHFDILCREEGTPSGWYNLTRVRVSPYSPCTCTPSATCRCAPTTHTHDAVTLVCHPSRRSRGGTQYPCSSRYKQLMVRGAEACGLKSSYRTYLKNLPCTLPCSKIATSTFSELMLFHSRSSRAAELYNQSIARPLQWVDNLYCGYLQRLANITMGTPFSSAVVLPFMSVAVIFNLILTLLDNFPGISGR